MQVAQIEGAHIQRFQVQLAGRHTRRLFYLRLVIFLFPTLIVMNFIFWILWPTSTPLSNLWTHIPHLNQSGITINTPDLIGSRGDGRPYRLRAVSATQFYKNPDIIELKDISADITHTDLSLFRIEAVQGIYHSKESVLHLNRDIIIQRDASQRATLNTAIIYFKTGHITTDQPVHINFSEGYIKAEGMDWLEQEGRLVFKGNVTLYLTHDAAELPLKRE